MGSEILINRSRGETRVAFLEEGSVKELYVERDEELGVVGNIYRGRVTRVLPGMQAAFVDIGLERAAFLHVDDVLTEIEDEEEVDYNGDEKKKDPRSISQLLEQGQQLTVQINKEPLGTKGARLTSFVTIPGRYVVYMPTMQRIGVSRRITQEAERKRLKELIQEGRVEGDGGYIARTVCEGLEPEEIRKDMDFVRSVWSEVSERARRTTAPALLQPDLDLVLRATRDLFTSNVERLVIDDPADLDRIKQLLIRCAPELAERVELPSARSPLFDQYGIEQEVERALMHKISLKSGATIVIDEAEALTAVDINTGSFVGSRDLEATILKTNLEAAVAIATQVRLRNLGGIIIVDFIDMQEALSREQVYQTFTTELAKDRAKTHVLQMSGLGLIQMTRKRVRPSLGRILSEPCPYCEGRGRVRSKRTVCLDIFREIQRKAQNSPEGSIMVSAMPEVACMLTEEEHMHLLELEAELSRSIIVEARSDLHQEVFQVTVHRAPSSMP